MEDRKRCKRCGAEKSLGEYYQDRSRPDGRRNTCIACDKERKKTPDVREQSKRYYHSEKGKAAESRYRESEKGRGARAAYELQPERIARRKATTSFYVNRWNRTENGRRAYERRKASPDYQRKKRSWHRRRLENPAYYARYLAYMRQAVQKRNTLKRQLPATLTEADWVRACDYFAQCCAYCGHADPLTQDHVIPLTSGGPYTPDNIVPACKSCNSRKCDSLPEIWCSPEVYQCIQEYFRFISG